MFSATLFHDEEEPSQAPTVFGISGTLLGINLILLGLAIALARKRRGQDTANGSGYVVGFVGVSLPFLFFAACYLLVVRELNNPRDWAGLPALAYLGTCALSIGLFGEFCLWWDGDGSGSQDDDLEVVA